MAKSTKLLLLESVDSLGIVGDVVNVRLGYARNFLLPRSLATTPSDELVQQLASKRAEAQRQLALLRKQREEIIGKLQGVEVSLTKSVNDQGILYGAITQQELSAALGEKGFGVKAREVRLTEVIKRIGNYDVHVKLDSDLDAVIKLHVLPDRELDLAKHEPGEGEDGAEGKRGRRGEDAPEGAVDGADVKADKPAKGEKHAKGDKKGDKPAKSEPKPEAKAETKGGWGPIPTKAGEPAKAEAHKGDGAKGKGKDDDKRKDDKHKKKG